MNRGERRIEAALPEKNIEQIGSTIQVLKHFKNQILQKLNLIWFLFGQQQQKAFSACYHFIQQIWQLWKIEVEQFLGEEKEGGGMKSIQFAIRRARNSRGSSHSIKMEEGSNSLFFTQKSNFAVKWIDNPTSNGGMQEGSSVVTRTRIDTFGADLYAQ